MENTTKKTKINYFEELRELIDTNATIEDDEKKNDMLAFIDKQIETLEKRGAAAKERAAKKREASDALTDAIYGVLTDELMTVDDILAALDDEDVTRNKITARLGKLVKADKVAKETVRIDGAKKMAYRLADVAEE